MAPLLVTALVGVGVKVATDLLMSGFKQLTRSSATAAPAAPTASFASALDRAKSAAAPMTASSGAVAVDAGLGDRSRVMAAELASGPLPGARGAGNAAQALSSYRRFDEIQAP